MELTRGQLFAIVIAILMVGSILGVVSYSNSNNAPPQATPADGEVPPATTVPYTASGVNVKVVQIFAMSVLIAKTSLASADEVDEAIRNTPGVALVTNSQFIATQEGGQNYRAEIRVVSPDNFAQVMDSINAHDSISDVLLYPQALVALDGPVQFENTALDIVQSYSFPSNQVAAFISPATLKGDEIVVTINADFAGSAISNPYALEQQNLNSAPQLHFVNGAFTLSSLENVFFVRAAGPVSMKGNLSRLQSGLEALSDGNSEFEIAQVSDSFIVTFSDVEGVAEQDLNNFLSVLLGVESFSIDLDLMQVSIKPSGTDYNAFGALLARDFAQANYNVISIDEPKVSMQGTITPVKPDTFVSDAKALSEQNFVLSEVLQQGRFDANSIFVQDSNVSFPLEAGHFFAYVLPSHKISESVNITALVFASERTGISQIQAQEAQ